MRFQLFIMVRLLELISVLLVGSMEFARYVISLGVVKTSQIANFWVFIF